MGDPSLNVPDAHTASRRYAAVLDENLVIKSISAELSRLLSGVHIRVVVGTPILEALVPMGHAADAIVEEQDLESVLNSGGSLRWPLAPGVTELTCIVLSDATRVVTYTNPTLSAYGTSDVERHYGTLMRNTLEGVWRIEYHPPISMQESVDGKVELAVRNGWFAECNDALAKMYGFDRATDFAGSPLRDFFSPGDSTNIKLNRQFFENNCYVKQAESREQTKNGKPRVFLNTLEGVIVDDLLIETWGVQLDITEREQATDALRESEERYHTFVSRTSEGIWRMGYHKPMPVTLSVDAQVEWMYSNAYFAYCNERAARHYGFDDPHELIGKSVLEVYPRSEANTAMLRELAQGGLKLDNGESEEVDAQGNTHYFLNNIVAIVEDGFMTSQWGTQTDITELKTAQASLQFHRDKLEQLIEERTAELVAAQDDLVKSERLATLGKLTGTVSHELRNPLGTISTSFSTLIQLHQLDDDLSQRAVARIERNIARMTRILDELLGYARDRNVKTHRVDIDPWLENVMREINAPASVNTKLDLQTGVSLSIDPERMRQVIINIVQNAHQAIAAREQNHRPGSLNVTTQLISNSWQAEFIDSGDGIEPAALEQVFDPLFSTRSFGVGLGLPLVKEIVELHGGSVEIQSRPHEYTTVKIRIPLHTRS